MKGWLIAIGALILAILVWWMGIWSIGAPPNTRSPAPPSYETGVPMPPPPAREPAPGSAPPSIPQGRDLGPPRTGEPPPVRPSR